MTRTQSKSALVILDMVSEFRFPDAEKILRGAQRAARSIARLKERASDKRVPVIYVNDTAGKWESDQQAFIRRCLEPASPGRSVVRLIAPEQGDYFLFKPRHSAFFGTPLDTLLTRLRVKRLILTGITSTNACCLPRWTRMSESTSLQCLQTASALLRGRIRITPCASCRVP